MLNQFKSRKDDQVEVEVENLSDFHLSSNELSKNVEKKLFFGARVSVSN